MAHAIFLIVGIGLLQLSWVTPRHEKIYGLILGGVAALYAGLRGNSTDYEEYVMLFNLLEGSSADLERIFIGKDVLFGVLMATVQAAGLGYQFMFLAAALGSIGLKYYAFRVAIGLTTAAMWATISTYYFLHDFIQIRVAIALGFGLWALIYAVRRQRTIFALFAVLGTGFHASLAFVIVMLTPVAFGMTRPSIRLTYLGAFMATLALAVLPQLSALDDRAWVYIEGEYTVNWVMQVIAPLKALVITYLYVAAISRTRDVFQRELAREALWLTWAGVLLFLQIGVAVPGIAFRVYEMFDAFSILILALAFVRGTAKTRLIALFYCAALLSQIIQAGILLPYKFAPASAY